MSLWTPYLEEPMDLTKQKPEGAGVAALTHDWPGFPREEPSQREVEFIHRDSAPVYSPPHRDTSSPGSVGSFDASHVTEDPEYQQFERDALQAMAQSNGGSLVHNNPRMRRDIQSTQTADDQYRKQRQRNNMAAKMSRDRRRMREVKLGIQVAYLARKLLELQNRLAEQVYEQPYMVPYK